MDKILNFYIDDSGARNPNKPGIPTAQGHDFFAFGGVLIKEEDEAAARMHYAQFCSTWGIRYPLHSVEIRHRSKNFSWMRKLEPREHSQFFEGLEELLLTLPVVGHGCVIDRPGYDRRYNEVYGFNKWSLCKTAFTVCVERAAKYAKSIGHKLRVLPERCGPKEDQILKQYYLSLKTVGNPFDEARSAEYQPLSSQEYQSLLYEFREKRKSSPMAQIADLYLWPICMGKYNPNYQPYERLLKQGKLVDSFLADSERGRLGIKYSCFD